ncbi:MAG: hypothetical protein BMS9Abin05_0925 [Rhodothermia bacterium]|nr:MAG: hypothetical protein BMS9Abin05_0925 [Rhodothermia bacterium]
MKRLLIPAFALFFIVGCAEQDDSDYATDATTDEAPETYDPDDTAMLRPDALKPVNERLEYPLGWKVRLDVPDSDAVISADTSSGTDVYLASMTPGWHVTMGRPRAILYHPASTAEGSYSASATIHLIEPGHGNEGYGLIFGGQNLDDDSQSYIYFLIRRSGDFLIKQRIGDDYETLSGWEANEAIVPYTEETSGTATNTLGVRVNDASISFFVNDTEVHLMEKGDLQTDGIVGLRMNHTVNAHIESLDVEQES